MKKKRSQRQTLALFSLPLVIGALVATPISLANAADVISTTGYVSMENRVIVSDTVSTATFPSSRGRAPATATYELGPGSAVTNYLGGGIYPGMYSVISDDQEAGLVACIPVDAVVGSFYKCHDRKVTITFSEPVINPQISLGSDSGGSENYDSRRCAVGWDEFTFSSINGTESPDGRVAPVRLDALNNFDGTSLRVDETAIWENVQNAPGCNGEYRPTPGGILQLNGLVTSVEVTITRAMLVTRADAPGAFPVKVWMGGSVVEATTPTVDLTLTKEAAAETVAPGGDIRWTLNVVNEWASEFGSAASHGFIVKDAVPANVTNAMLETPVEGCELSGNDLVCDISPENCAVTLLDENAPTAALNCASSADAGAAMLPWQGAFEPIVITAKAPQACSTPIENSAQVIGVDADMDLSNNSDSVTVTTASVGCENPPVEEPNDPPVIDPPTTDPLDPTFDTPTPKPERPAPVTTAAKQGTLAVTGESTGMTALLGALGFAGVVLGAFAIRRARA